MFLEVYPHVLGVSTLKRCSKCGEYKPRELFSKSNAKRDGLNCRCKSCVAIYHLTVKERHNAQTRENARVRRQSQEYRAVEAERNRIYHQTHKAEIAERKRRHNAETGYTKRYKQEHTEEIRQIARAYSATDRGKLTRRAGWVNRRARVANAPGSHTADDLIAIRAAQTDKQGRLICWRCGKPINGTPHLDHWIPIKEGGANDAGNLHYMHAKCNRSKSAKLPHEIGRLL